MPTGPKPKADAQRKDQRRHQIKYASTAGWQHGDPNDKRRKTPKAPAGLMLPESRAAWDSWFRSWWAAFWTLEDLAALELVAQLFDEVKRGQTDVAKLTPLLDRYGITPKGRQDLRWEPPEAAPAPSKPAVTDELTKRRNVRKLA